MLGNETQSISVEIHNCVFSIVSTRRRGLRGLCSQRARVSCGNVPLKHNISSGISPLKLVSASSTCNGLRALRRRDDTLPVVVHFFARRVAPGTLGGAGCSGASMISVYLVENPPKPKGHAKQGVVELFRRGMDTCAIGFDFSPEKNQPTYSKAPPWALNAAPLPPKRVAVTS